jgi:hypothetical protein
MISELDRDLAELQQAAGAYAARHRRITHFGYPPGGIGRGAAAGR